MRESLAFFSEYEYDKVIYADIISREVPSGQSFEPYKIEIDTDIEYPMAISISYTYGGTNIWYSNGQYEQAWSSNNQQYMPVLYATADFSNKKITIKAYTGPFGAKTTKFRINGISL